MSKFDQLRTIYLDQEAAADTQCGQIDWRIADLEKYLSIEIDDEAKLPAGLKNGGEAGLNSDAGEASCTHGPDLLLSHGLKAHGEGKFFGCSVLSVSEIARRVVNKNVIRSEEFYELRGEADTGEELYGSISMDSVGMPARGIVFERGEKGYQISWDKTFALIGVENPDSLFKSFGVLSYGAKCCFAETALVYRLLACLPVALPELNRLFSQSNQRHLLRACMERNVLSDEAVYVAEAILARLKEKDHDAERISLLLSVCRKAPFYQGVEFNEALFRKETAHLCRVYAGVIDEIAMQMAAICKNSLRPSIMIKYAEGSPVETIAAALARSLSETSKYTRFGSCTSGLDIVGCYHGYSNAACSRITQALSAANGASILFSDIDSLCLLKKDDGDPVQFMRQMLSGGNPKDAYLDAPIQVGGTAIVATEPLRTEHTEFDGVCTVVISVPALSRAEKLDAAREILKRSELDATDEAISKLVDEHALDVGTNMLTASVDALAVQLAEAGIVEKLEMSRIDELLPAPNEEDERLWVVRKRASLEQLGADHIKAAEDLLDAITQSKHKDGRANPDDVKKLKMLVRSAPASDARLDCPDLGTMKQTIQETHPGINETIVERLVTTVRASVGNQVHAKPILLLGPAGTGKTTIVETIANMLGTQAVKRDMSGLSILELFGSPLHPSCFTEALASRNGLPTVFLLDEIDKMTLQLCDSSALCSLLDYGRITDCYLNLLCDFSNSLFVLTANNESKISDYVLNRVQLVRLDGYTSKEKLTIVESTLLARKAKELCLDPPVFSRDAMEWVVSVDDEAGLRSLERHLELIIASHDGANVTLDDVSALLPKKERGALLGVLVVMPREGARGGAACASVMACKTEDQGIEIISGSDEFQCSLKLALSAHRLRHNSSTAGMIVSLDEAGDDLDQTYAPLCELGATVAMNHAFEKIPASQLEEVAFVGAVSAFGEVFPMHPEHLDKARFIVDAAARYDAKTLVCPENLANNASAIAVAVAADINLIGVKTLGEAISFAIARHDLEKELDALLR